MFENLLCKFHFKFLNQSVNTSNFLLISCYVSTLLVQVFVHVVICFIAFYANFYSFCLVFQNLLFMFQNQIVNVSNFF